MACNPESGTLLSCTREWGLGSLSFRPVTPLASRHGLAMMRSKVCSSRCLSRWGLCVWRAQASCAASTLCCSCLKLPSAFTTPVHADGGYCTLLHALSRCRTAIKTQVFMGTTCSSRTWAGVTDIQDEASFQEQLSTALRVRLYSSQTQPM